MTTEHLTLERQFDGMSDLPGAPTSAVLGGPLSHYLANRGTMSWASLGAMTPSAIREIKGVGDIRLARVLAEIERCVHAVDGAAAAAATAGGSASTGTATAIEDHLVDPVAAGERFLASLNEREVAILERVLDLDGSAPTLEHIGQHFDVTRERIRQIEQRVRQRLALVAADPEYTSLWTAATLLRDRLDAAVPLDTIRDDFAGFPPDYLDRLLLHLAGPYRVRDGWVVRADVPDVPALVLALFEDLTVEGSAPLSALLERLAEAGLRPDVRDEAVAACCDLRLIEDTVVDWRGSVGSKAERLLALKGEPILVAELGELIGVDNTRNLGNQLADSRFVRVGKQRYGLAVWDVTEFRGVVPAMIAAIEAAGGYREVADLAQEIHLGFDASPNSVKILATTHPVFLTVDGRVMLRPEDQPYQPKQSLESSRDCLLVDGSWAWRVPVDHDVLRGSGRGMPEAFAVHLGMTPLSKSTIDSPIGPIRLGWQQGPHIGTLRRAAESAGAEEGDRLLVISESSGRLSFQRVPRDGCADPAPTENGQAR